MKRNRRKTARGKSASCPTNHHSAPVDQQSRIRRQNELITGSARDGYQNALAGLGDASPLLASGTFLRSGLTSDIALLTTLYRESWLAKRIIDMPSEDMTRAWIRITSDLDDGDMRLIEKAMKTHLIRKELTDAVRWARLYGGSLAVMVIDGEEDMLDQPLRLSELMPDSFRGLLVLDKTCGISPGIELVTDLDDPDYGLPEYYQLEFPTEEHRILRVHHSRVLRFVARELPYTETVYENYWGASELEHIWEEIQKRSATSANIAQLVFRANITTLKMSDFGETLALGTPNQRQRIRETIEEENRIRTSFGLQLLSADDSMETHPYSFSGLAEVYELFMMDMAGAAEIPATRLFGRSPQGLNATGESDMKLYYEKIGQLQENMLRPALDRLLPVLFISTLGFLPEELDYVFEPLATQDPMERANIISTYTDTVIRLCDSHLLTPAQGIAQLKNLTSATGAFQTLELNDEKPETMRNY